ncbi:MAG TPA: aspartate-semialdehyde dehydrogenase [Clostridiales bacterium]|nr:aspartate-semialdehyde dehydrogenase [Clostridiales bacterium]
MRKFNIENTGKSSYNIAVVGATGMVGRTMLQVLREYEISINKLYLFASSKSAGQKIDYYGKEAVIEELTESSFEGKDIDIALFSAGGDVSRKYAPVAASSGAVVIDNSSAFRMEKDIPLIVPEVNTDDLIMYKNRGIIANPNCSTIQAVVVLKPLQKAFGLKRVIYSTYQAVSGAGMGGVQDLENTLQGKPHTKFMYPIANNCIPQIDVFLDSGYTKEEQKLIDETRKILNQPDLAVTATAVRIPVLNGHSESINIELEREFTIEEIRTLLENSPGVLVHDDPESFIYPMPLMISGKDSVSVGRIRMDTSHENCINIFVCGDNIRKGAASNAVQIAQALINYCRR